MVWALIYWAPAQVFTLTALNDQEQGAGGWRQLDFEDGDGPDHQPVQEDEGRVKGWRPRWTLKVVHLYEQVAVVSVGCKLGSWCVWKPLPGDKWSVVRRCSSRVGPNPWTLGPNPLTPRRRRA